MRFCDLAEAAGIKSDITADVKFITDNSKKVSEGCVFVCIKGLKFDGHTVASAAVESGAVAVITEKDLGLKQQVIVPNSRKAYTVLCSAFFGFPQRKLKLIGITGTNGKTTSAFIIKSIIESTGASCGLIGTVKNCVGMGIEYGASLTTPDPNDLFNLFSQMVDNGCEYCVMEVSSQALHQCRVEGIHFMCSIFTNLTVDHLDYHGTKENYAAAKHILFENSDKAVFNADDEASEYMMQGTMCKNKTFSVKNGNCDYVARNIVSGSKGVKYELCMKNETVNVEFPVPGFFSVYNSMGAAACLIEAGFSPKAVAEGIKECVGVPGRMEIVKTDTPYSIIIDYAHTPDGLENMLSSVKQFTENRLIAVFGCGGDRDRTKRPVMGEIGARIADVAIITSDNPRTEDPQAIIDEVLAGTKEYASKVISVCDRTKAIEKAIEIAQPGDVIALAGKGHETYQILASGKIHYDEREIVKNILESK